MPEPVLLVRLSHVVRLETLNNRARSGIDGADVPRKFFRCGWSLSEDGELAATNRLLR